MAIGYATIMNGLLPEKHRIRISTIEYNKLTRLEMLVYCTSCETEFSISQIKLYDRYNSLIQELLLDELITKCWKCRQCNKINLWSKTQKANPKIREPTFLGVVDEPPIRSSRLIEQTSYHEEFGKWLSQRFFKELEKKVADYREEYLQRNPGTMEALVSVPEELVA